MAGTPGTFRFPEVNATPPAPPAGYALLYIKTDNVLYLQDSSATEIALGSASAITSLTGDVVATGPGSVSAVVMFVGGKSAAQVAQSVTDTAAATASNTPSVIVKRDGSGNFAAGTITANLTGVASNATTAVSFSGGLIGDVTGTQGSTVVSLVGGKSAAQVAQSVTDTAAATASNTPSTLVLRDSSGNFAAGTITASLTGNVSGSSASFTGSLVGDVTGTQSATVVSTVGSSTAANVHSAELLANASTSINTASTIVRRNASGDFAAGTITANLIGNASNATIAISFSGSLAGDVTGTQGSTVVALVGGKTATEVAQSVSSTQAATDSNIVNTIVKRDGSGNFVANQITANLIGNVSGSAASFTGSLSGDVTGTQSATVVALVGGKTSAAVAQSVTDTQAATDSNIASTIIKRDASGNFSAGTITANLTGNVSGTAANVTSVVNIPHGGTNSSTALNNNRVMKSSAGAIVEAAAITAARALISDSNGIPTQSVTTSTELSYVSGVTSSIQSQLNAVSGSAITALTGDVVAIGPGSVAASIAKIQGTAVSGTTGSTNVVFSNSPTITGLLSGSSANFSSSITASNLSGTNTGDVTIVDTNSIDLTLTGQQVIADLKLSTDAADANNIKATASIHSGAGAGLHVEIPFSVPVQIGTSNSAGAASSVALSDHVHAHGNQTVGTLHAAATGSVNGFMSASDKTKLDAATASNTPSTLVLRDSSGNFAAGTITANLTGNVTGNVSGSAATITGNLTGDVTSVGMATTIAQGVVTDDKASLATKPSIAVVATSNLVLTGLQTIDGVTVTTNTLVLLTAQTTGSENGPWQAQAGAWIRPSWYPSGGTTQAFRFITTFVRLGTLYQGSVWRQTAAGPITIDTTSTTWAITPLALNSSTLNGTIPNGNTSGTSANTPSTLVLRDSSGNFAAGTITASLTGNVLGNLTGNVTGNVSGTAANVTSVVAIPNGGTNSSAALNNNRVMISNLGAIVEASAILANRALVSDANGIPTHSVTTTTELSYVSGVTSAIQTQLNAKQATGNYITALTGDVVATGPGSVAATIQTNVVSNSKLAQMAANTLKGNNTGGTANASDLTVAQVNTMLGTVTSVSASSPLQSSGGATPTVSFSNQSANTVLAGPTTGSAAAPTFRSLVNADLPLPSTTTKSGNYTILTTDSVIFVDSSGGAFTLTLPDPSLVTGKIYRIIGTSGTMQTNNVTLARHASEKINGLAASKALQTNWGFFQLVTNGTDWFVD